MRFIHNSYFINQLFTENAIYFTYNQTVIVEHPKMILALLEVKRNLESYHESNTYLMADKNPHIINYALHGCIILKVRKYVGCTITNELNRGSNIYSKAGNCFTI